MDYVDFKGRNLNLGAPAGWDEKRDGPCGALPARRVAPPGQTPYMESYWLPSETDLANLLAGHVVRLTVYGTVHPPVAMAVAPWEKK